ncbi:TIGR03086 family metal-binding protein [Streptomyces sp. DSM 44917]|uniref:TIGR03086 family metal-binding protein n=1 Tax=Streptomyces boetiae TaxID=3075541 RepID=A0ABU2L6A0_9ACTN|nr:TIGR03086 family metal-binding protein [Streptomyces sp. DSM 44917]MDT0307085.1 TIGR03086 family metal-binding protein [Streptomyces sp. DSM 44917]
MSEETNAMADLGPVARGVAGLLDGVGEDRLDDPTPCEEYRVRDLLRHLLGLTLAFRAAGRKELGEYTRTNPADPESRPPSLGGDWRGRLREQLEGMAEAWRDPAAWEGTTEAGGVTLPGAVAGQVGLNELLVHGWDLAVATGQPYACDEASARVSIALLSHETDDADRDTSGIFGHVVPVPPDAPLLDRAIALSGRRPDWTP